MPQALAERDARRLRPAAAGSVLLAVLLSIALARYPHQFHWRSASGVTYLVFLATMLLTGAVGLTRGLPHPPVTERDLIPRRRVVS